jgi:pimeloyl-ACP methyl ester carboxylesterase
MATRFVDRMAVEIDGEGDAVLMIHGLGGSSNVWTPLMPSFARCRTVRPDLPGSARSARVEGPLSIDRFVQAMLRVAGAAGVERAHVVAHSLGTIVAFHLAAAAPHFVRSLALFGPLLAPADAIRGGIRGRGEKARTEGEAGMQEIANALVQAATSAETKAKRPATAALVREFLMRQPPDGYARTCDALAAAQPADTTKITCPTLLVTGDEDAVAPAGSVRQIAERMPGCRLEILRGCGHWTPIEKPDECNDLLRRFYETNRR